MSLNWIKLELPFNYVELVNIPYPNLDDKAKLFFGQTLAESRNGIRHLWDKFVSKRNFLIKLNKNLTNNSIDDYIFNNYVEFLPIMEHRKFVEKYNEWEISQDEISDYHDKVSKKLKEIKRKSFCGLGLNVPGTLIRIKSNNEIKEYLIGHITADGSFIGDGEDSIGYNDEVIEYTTVWSNNT